MHGYNVGGARFEFEFLYIFNQLQRFQFKATLR